MTTSLRPRGALWLPAFAAALAFAGVAVVFACETRSFRAAVFAWAGNDLESRTRIAVETLREPLLTGDFAAVHRFSAECAVDHVRVSVFGKPRGLVFDSVGDRSVTAEGDYLFGPEMDAGAFTVRLALPRTHVLASFHRAQRSFAVAALLGVTGVLLFFVVIYRQRVRLREMMRVERFRREFVADVSHEIKTPLTGILGAVDLLADGATDADGREAALLAMIRKESTRLNGLVQGILDLSRLEREGLVLNAVETDLAALVCDVAARQGVACSVAPEPVARLCAAVDPQLVEQALVNLVENAKRHSGSADIRLGLVRTNRGFELSVEDHGVGVPPQQAERIFERFHRVDPARAAETGGAGLGLAIVRRIARLHGGDAVCRPARPHGAVFVLTLPGAERSRSAPRGKSE